MDDKIPKYFRWLALILYRSRVDTMKFYGVSSALQKTFYGLLTILLFSGATAVVYFLGEIRSWLSLLGGIVITWVFLALFITPYRLYDEVGGLDKGLSLEVSQSHRIPEKSWWAGIEVSPKGSSPVDVYAKVEEIYFTHRGEIGKDFDTWFLKPQQRLPWASGRMSETGVTHIGRGDSDYLQIVQHTIRGIAIVPHPLPKALPQVYELISSLMPYFIVVSIYDNNVPKTKIFRIGNCSMGKCEVSLVEKIG